MHFNNRDVSIHQYHEAPDENACVLKSSPQAPFMCYDNHLQII